MGASSYIRKSFAESTRSRSDAYRHRLSAWRRQKTIERVERPLNPVRARELGYKATKDFVVVRVRAKRGKRVRRKPDLGRKPGKNRKRENPGKPWKWFAEQKAARRYKNLRVVNSYSVGKDGQNQYFEIILGRK